MLKTAMVRILGFLALWVLSSVPFLPGILLGLDRYSSLTGWLLWAAGMPVFFAGAWLVTRLTTGGTLGELGLKRHEGWGRNLLLGLALGSVWILLYLGARVAAGQLQITGLASWRDAALWCLLFLLNFAFVAVSEELVFRGYLMRYLPRSLSPGWVATITAVVFALAHIPMQGTAPLNLVGLVLAGLLFVLATQLTGSLWLAIGLHWSIDAVGWMLVYTDAVVVKQYNPAGNWVSFLVYGLDLLTIGVLWLLRHRLGKSRQMVVPAAGSLSSHG